MASFSKTQLRPLLLGAFLATRVFMVEIKESIISALIPKTQGKA